jgi:FMN-dependent NADH-azoreductase
MNKLLYVKASPRSGRSHAIAVADAFVDSYKESHAGSEVLTMDLFTKELPDFDGLAVQAKYTILHGEKHSQEELDAWKAVEAVIEEFKGADKYLFAVPMWNFGVPYRLKQYIDILLQPSYTFSYTPEEGYTGLVTGKPAFVTYSRGGEYPAGTDSEVYDFQKRYFETVLGFIGFTEIQSVVIEPTLMGGPETAAEKRNQAIAEAKKAAVGF